MPNPRTSTRAALLPNSIRATPLSLPFLSLSCTHTDTPPLLHRTIVAAGRRACWTRHWDRDRKDRRAGRPLVGPRLTTHDPRPRPRPTTERTKLSIYLWFGGLPRTECARCGTLRLVIVFVRRVRVYTRGLARSFTAARSFRPLAPLELNAIRPRSALLGCHPARHGGNPGPGPGPSSAGRREGEA